MTVLVSIIIPNRNGGANIGKCLEAAFCSDYKNFEVIVVDDCSADHSVELIKQFPCKFIQLEKHSGASRARNVGADLSSGDILFFTDADCLLNEDALTIAVETLSSAGPNIVLGGTYTTRPFDDTFFSRFQSVFINYSETRNAEDPDYIATHAMIIYAHDFKKSGGFAESYLPILEDVEFSHRIRRKGCRLLINPAIQVRHIFGYSLAESMCNAFRKSMFWTAYSINNKDLFKDSGTASKGLKLNTAVWLINVLVLLLAVLSGEMRFLCAILLTCSINMVWNFGLLAAFYSAGGKGFLAVATAYYILVYPVAVAVGSVTGMLRYPWLKEIMRGAD